MKHLILIVLLIAAAQYRAYGANAPTPTAPHVVAKTPTDKINLRIRQQVLQVERDVKLGKLTKDQAKTLTGQVEAVRKQEIADLKANGTKTLTDAQVVQLNSQLNTLSKSIPIK